MRLPFVTASVTPYFIGAAYIFAAGGYNIFTARFFSGLSAVVSSHLAANIFNDYFDSKSGNDWQDSRDHTFFGGSKVIQHGLLTEGEVFRTASFFLIIAALSIVALQIMIPDIPVIGFGLIILILAVSYTAPPLKLT